MVELRRVHDGYLSTSFLDTIIAIATAILLRVYQAGMYTRLVLVQCPIHLAALIT